MSIQNSTDGTYHCPTANFMRPVDCPVLYSTFASDDSAIYWQPMSTWTFLSSKNCFLMRILSFFLKILSCVTFIENMLYHLTNSTSDNHYEYLSGKKK